MKSKCKQCGAECPVEQEFCRSCTQTEQETLDATIPPQTDVTPAINSDVTIAPTQTSFSSSHKKSFGDYEIVDEIARGGMGVVYKAKDRKLNRLVALKMILGGQFSSPDDRQRFRIEAEAAAALDHVGIVPVYEFGEYEDQPFFAMKYVEGGSMADRMAGFSDNPRDGVEMLIRVARAIHHAHQCAILHRDLKPANILIDATGQPMVTDFGLAKNTGGDSNLTESGAVLGTPKYIAPEQAAGNQSITTAADIYSLGAILYEILTGRGPHDGASAVETLMNAIANEPVNPSQLNRSVNRELELICGKAISRDPDQRYSSAAAFADDLESWLNGKSISVAAPNLAAQLQRWLKRNRKLTYVLFAIVVSLFFALPILINLFAGGGSDIADVYQHFPEDSRPLLFQTPKLPNWVDDVLTFWLLFVIWPMFGFMNAMVTKANSIIDAFRIGIVTSLFCAITVLLLLGWVFFTAQTIEYSSDHIEILANAVWAEGETDRLKAEAAADQLFPGLDEVPKDIRPKVLMNRIAAEQIAFGPIILFRMLLVCGIVAIPVIYGTVIAHVLLERKTAKWVALVRYVIAWLFIGHAFISLSVATGLFQGDGAGLTAAISLLIGLAISWLVLRRWRSPVNEAIAT